MIEKPLTWNDMVDTAKTIIIHRQHDGLYWIEEEDIEKLSPNQEKDTSIELSMVSKDLVLRLQEQLRKLLDDFGSIDDYDNDDVIDLVKGLREVLGSGKGENKP